MIDKRERKCCPFCDSLRIYKVRNNKNKDNVGKYKCMECLKLFESANFRFIKNSKQNHNTKKRLNNIFNVHLLNQNLSMIELSIKCDESYYMVKKYSNSDLKTFM